jgi:hypothetical protein
MNQSPHHILYYGMCEGFISKDLTWWRIKNNSQSLCNAMFSMIKSSEALKTRRERWASKPGKTGRILPKNGIQFKVQVQSNAQTRHAMPKEKSINPAQAQRKAEKAKAIKKGTIAIPIRRSTLCNLVLTIYLSSRQSRSRIAPQRETRTPEPRPSTEATWWPQGPREQRW